MVPVISILNEWEITLGTSSSSSSSCELPASWQSSVEIINQSWNITYEHIPFMSGLYDVIWIWFWIAYRHIVLDGPLNIPPGNVHLWWQNIGILFNGRVAPGGIGRQGLHHKTRFTQMHRGVTIAGANKPNHWFLMLLFIEVLPKFDWTEPKLRLRS